MADDVVIRLSATGGGRVRSEVVSVGGEFLKLGDKAEKGAAQANTALGRLDQRLRTLGRGVDAGAGLKDLGARASLFVSVPLALALRESTQEATRLQSAVAATNETFGDAASGVLVWSQTTLDGIGLARAEAVDAATAFGAVFQQAGVAQGDAAQLAQQWVQLAVDMQAARSSAGTLDNALGGLRGALRGEYDELQRFLPAVSAAAIQQYALANGITQSTGPLTDQQRLLATVGLLTQQMAQYTGTFAERSGTAAVEQQKAAAAAREAAAELGERLLPAQTKVNQATATLAGAFAALPDAGQTFAAYGIAAATAFGPIATLAGGVLQFIGVLRVANAAQQAAAAATAATSTAMNSAASVSTLYAKSTSGVGASLAGLATPLALVTAGVAVLGFSLSQRGKDVRKFVSEAAEATTEELVEAFDRLNEFDGSLARDAFRDIADQSEGTARRIVAGMRAAGQDTAEFERILRDVAAGHRRAARDAQDQTGAAFDLDGVLKGLTDTLNDGADAMDRWADSLPLLDALDAAAASRTYEAELAKLNEMVRDNADAERERQQAVEDARRNMEDAAAAQVDAQERLTEATARLAEAQRGVSEVERRRLDLALRRDQLSAKSAARDLSAAEERLARLSAGASPKARAEAEAAVEEARLAVDEANQRVADSEKAVEDARPGSAAQARIIRDAEREVERARRDVAEASERARDAQDELRRAQENAKPSAEELARRERELADQMDRVVQAAAKDVSLNFDQPITATQNFYDRIKALGDLLPQLQPLIDTYLASAPPPLSPSAAGRISREADDGGVFTGPTQILIGRRVGREAWIPQQGISDQRAAGLLGTAAAWHGYRLVRMDDGGILGAGGRQFAQAQAQPIIVEKTTVENYQFGDVTGPTLDDVKRESRREARRKSLSRGSRGRRG